MSSPASNDRSSSITRGMVCSSFSAGTIATRRSSKSAAGAGVAPGSSTISGTGHHGHAEPEQIQQVARAMCVGVLVEHTLTGATAHLFGLAGVGEQIAIRGGSLVGIRD